MSDLTGEGNANDTVKARSVLSDSLCAGIIPAAPGLCTVRLRWKYFAKFREKFRGKEHLWKILLEGWKTQSAQCLSCLAVLWVGDVVLRCKRRDCAQFLSVSRNTEVFKGNNYINIVVSKTANLLATF